MGTVEDLFDENLNKNFGLYNNLAVLYDFMYKKKYNYTNQHNVIVNSTDDSINTVLEGACGTGRLLKLLNKKYDVVGFDKNKDMISIARENCPNVDIRKRDLTTIKIKNSFDCYCVLGNSIIHLTEDSEFKQFIQKSKELLNKNGYIVFDYLDFTDLDDKNVQKDVFENKNVRVYRTTASVKKTKYQYYITFSFELLNKNTDETMKIKDTILGRVYNPTFVESTLTQHGFSEVNTFKCENCGPELSTITIGELSSN